MCRPPDLAPAAPAFGSADTLDPFVPEVDDWANDGNNDGGDFDNLGSDVAASLFLGKRGSNDDARLAEAISRAAKLPRSAAPVSSAFDSAAASFVARMEQSMLQDMQRLQSNHQQRRFPVPAAAPAMKGEDALLMQRALLQQQAQQLQQLQQLQLLKQLQQPKVDHLTAEHQLLLAQQQLFQQSQGQILNAMNPTLAAAVAASGASAPPAAMASFMRAPLAAGACNPLANMNRQHGDTNLQAWMQAMQGNVAGPPMAAKPLAVLQPKPTAASVAAAAMAAAGATPDLNSAAAMFGLGSSNGVAQRNSGLVLGEEKKVKRMQSNRASAKRSRQRRQARLEELDKSTSVLQTENVTMCSKLELAQQEICVLEDKNRSLLEEVAQLRKLLGMEAHAPAVKRDVESARWGSKGGAAASGGGHLQSCVESESTGSGKSPQLNKAAGKGDAQSELVDMGAGELDENDDQLDLDVKPVIMGSSAPWLPALPLSPGAKLDDVPCGLEDMEGQELDQILVQGDVFSEFLACLEA